MRIQRLDIRLLILAAALAVLSAFYGHSRVSADHGGAWLPGDPMSYPAQAREAARGEVRYCFDGVASAYPNAKAQAESVTGYATSHGMMPARLVPVGSECDEYIQAPSPSAFNQLCGSGAYGCIYYWHDPIDVYINLQSPTAYYYNDSTFCHEGINTGHAMFLNEEYHDDWTNGNVYSNGRTWTCMDYGVAQPGDPLGRNVWALPDWDRDRIFNAFVPDAPAWASVSRDSHGWAVVSWSMNRKDGGAAHVNGIASNSSATRMTFGVSDCDGCPIRWAGNDCGAAFNYCYSAYKDGSRSFDPYWSGCFYVRAENAGFWNVPQISAPAYWTLAGCAYVPPSIPVNFPTELNAAVCIAWNESSFNAGAVNENANGTEDRGEFQINSVNLPTVTRLGYTWAEMFDSDKNARVAAELRRVGGWRLWSTAGRCGL